MTAQEIREGGRWKQDSPHRVGRRRKNGWGAVAGTRAVVPERYRWVTALHRGDTWGVLSMLCEEIDVSNVIDQTRTVIPGVVPPALP
jgi:hypothetical protein